MPLPEDAVEDIDENLQDVMDWNKYEASAYRALVDEGPLEAQEVVVRTAIPKGRIYDILDSLQRDGFVESQQRNPTIYWGKNPETILNERRDSFEDKVTDLSASLGPAYDLNVEDGSDAISSAWILGGQAGTVRKLRELIPEADSSVRAIDADPRWYETRDARMLEGLDRGGVAVDLVIWRARQTALDTLASFDIDVWVCDEPDKTIYIIDNETVVFTVDDGDTGIVFSDRGAATVFTRAFEATYDTASPYDDG